MKQNSSMELWGSSFHNFYSKKALPPDPQYDILWISLDFYRKLIFCSALTLASEPTTSCQECPSWLVFQASRRDIMRAWQGRRRMVPPLVPSAPLPPLSRASLQQLATKVAKKRKTSHFGICRLMFRLLRLTIGLNWLINTLEWLLILFSIN